MNNILLISEDTLKTYSNLNDNTFGKWILPAIKESQEMGLMPIIGECLYNKICELVADGSINDVLFTAYKDLLDDKIQPYLIYKTLSNIIPILNAKMANIGTVLTNDEHVINLTQGESDLLKTYYSERCDFYTKRLQDFIKNNKSAFPEISCDCGNMQPNLESSENSVGVWLGGSRGKKINDNKCGCSSTEVTCADYQSGFTDGVEFQKRKLEVTGFTENGRYIREDGYSEVTVDVPQTGYTEEEMLEKYSQGYRQGQYFQKTLLSAITITQNGNYDRANGYSAITVDVAGQEPSLIPTAITANGEYFPAQGYDGFSSIEVNVPQTGYEDGYQSGYTDGFNEAYNLLGLIEVVPSYNNIHYNDTALTITVTSNIPWRITSYPEWAVPNITSYSGSTVIDITLPVNTGNERRGNIIFNSVIGSVSASVYIRQGRQPSPIHTDYLTFEALESCEVFFAQQEVVPTTNLDYKINDGNWITFTGQTVGSGVTIASLNRGDKMRLRGVNSTIHSGRQHVETSSFYTHGRHNLSGNILSIIYGDDYDNYSTFSEDYCFSSLFAGCGVVSAKNLILPDNVTQGCYEHMFSNCTSLTTAPVLPATTLMLACYRNMFDGCTSLTTAPELPATTLAKSCYSGMFEGCISLTTAPELPATTLQEGCYREMFYGCTSLNYIKCLATNKSATYCTHDWVAGVAASGTFVKNPISNWDRGVDGIPSGWTVIV